MQYSELHYILCYGGLWMITTIVKRDGRTAAFQVEKIASAIFKAAQATGGRDYDTALDLAKKVAEYLNR